MSAKNLPAIQARQRISVDGKQLRTKVLLAVPDNEYQLMRPDLTYIDLRHYLRLSEPAQNIEFEHRISQKKARAFFRALTPRAASCTMHR